MTPILNVVTIFIGIGQISLPQRDVSRLLFANFVLFCLIIRTAYKECISSFFSATWEKKPVASIEELEGKNFTTIVNQFANVNFYFNELNLFQR